MGPPSSQSIWWKAFLILPQRGYPLHTDAHRWWWEQRWSRVDPSKQLTANHMPDKGNDLRKSEPTHLSGVVVLL